MSTWSLPPPEPDPLPREIVATPIEGYRIWRIVRSQPLAFDGAALAAMAEAHDRGENPFRSLAGPRLQSVGVGDFAWPTRATEAACNQPVHALKGSGMSFRVDVSHAAQHATPAPQPHCTCGIWAYRKRRRMYDLFARYLFYGEHPPQEWLYAFGRVRLWGHIIEHELGWRGQWAQPISLTVIGEDENLARGLADFYGCDAKTGALPGRMVKIRSRLRREMAEAEQRYEKRQRRALEQDLRSGVRAGGYIGEKTARPKRHRVVWALTALAGVAGAATSMVFLVPLIGFFGWILYVICCVVVPFATAAAVTP